MKKLILLRHGQSQWNLENRFTGWKDILLSKQGIKEAIEAGEMMKKNNISLDLIFSSVLKRANETARLAVSRLNLNHLWNKNNDLIMLRTKALNERDYGDLVGLNKKDTAIKYGEKQVHTWRRSFDIRPPGGESLKDVVERVKPYFINNIEPKIKNNNILVAAHGNSLRAMLICVGLHLPEEISKIEIPTGIPLVLFYEESKLVKSKYLV